MSWPRSRRWMQKTVSVSGYTARPSATTKSATSPSGKVIARFEGIPWSLLLLLLLMVVNFYEWFTSALLNVKRWRFFVGG